MTTAATALFLSVLFVSAVFLVTGDADAVPSGAPLAWLVVLVIALVVAGIDRTRAWLDLRRRRRAREALEAEWETQLRASGRWQ